MRIVIAGVPKAGKTTLSEGYKNVHHTDDLIRVLGWSELSQEVAEWFYDPGPWVIEGVATVRALRKWLRDNPEGTPCDEVIFLGEPHIELTPRQQGMAKGICTIWEGVQTELKQRGVTINDRSGAGGHRG